MMAQLEGLEVALFDKKTNSFDFLVTIPRQVRYRLFLQLHLLPPDPAVKVLPVILQWTVHGSPLVRGLFRSQSPLRGGLV